MRAIVVLSFTVNEETLGEQMVDIIRVLKPTKLPHFADEVRVSIGSDAETVERWLDGIDDKGVNY